MINLATLLLGVFVILGGALTDHVPISSLLNLTAFIIVMCGSVSACLVQFGFHTLCSGFKAVMWLAKPPRVNLSEFIDHVADWSAKARGFGTLVLEQEIPNVADPFQRQGLQMIVDNTAPEDFASMLSILAENLDREQEHPAHVWEALGGYSPTIGVMGAVLGLIHVMMRLDHPSELGEGIATAFIATVYGVGFANLIALPLGGRLKTIAKELERERMVVIQGFLLLAEGKPGIVIRQTLKSFLHEKPTAKAADDEQEAPAGASQAA
ncbi:MAG: flagellar motor protein [Rhodospirillales bacterium]|nr:flagellar motor protein [Rhodospirillales bacterium]MDE2319915.1 flagellar motor protein [Rhodospirillales bacterium]